MSLDHDLLRTTLARETEELVVPELDLPRLLERGELAVRRRRIARRRRVLVAAAVISVVLGVVAALTLAPFREPGPAGGPEPAPEPGIHLKDLPWGERPAIPYCSGGDLIREGGRAIPSRCLTMEHRGRSTVGFDERGVYLVGNGEVRLLDQRVPGSWVPALSQDGRYAAWVSSDSGRGRLLVFDLSGGTKVAEASVPWAYDWVPGIDDRGRVYVQSFASPDRPSRIWAYDIPHERLTRVRGVPPLPGGAALNYVTADGLALRGDSFVDTGQVTSESTEGVVTPDGRFVSRGDVPIGWSFWSADRSHVVQETREGFWVQSASDLKNPVLLGLPSDGRVVSSPTWETADTLLVGFDPAATPGTTVDIPDDGFAAPTSRLWILRCAADTGRCEVALGPGNGGDAHGSMFR